MMKTIIKKGKLLIKCRNCSHYFGKDDLKVFQADDRFFKYKCSCGKTNLIPKRELDNG